MVATPTHFISTNRVILRLRAEGWVDCSGLEFPALSQAPIGDLSKFVLTQLNDFGWMWQTELQLKSLIFSISTHEFQVHPHLGLVLTQLESAEIIVMQRVNRPVRSKNKVETAIVLSSRYNARFAKQIEQTRMPLE